MNGHQQVYYIGIDVGTGSARACIIDQTGDIVGIASEDIHTWQSQGTFYEQSTTNIWRSICRAVKQAVRESGIASSDIRGLGFDATCSLAVMSRTSNQPISVTGPDFNTDCNVVLWLDHRAVQETKSINETKHNVLRYVGGTMSVEMEIPKILWLKKRMPADMFKDCKFYDLADALTHMATGTESRSFCSVICKQGYIPAGVDESAEGWQEDFLTSVGLGDLAADNFFRLGGINGCTGQYLSAGECVGQLSYKAAAEMGLSPGVAVGSGVIDAYAGWIGTVGAKVDLGAEDSTDGVPHIVNRLALVAGTSTCHLAMSHNPVFVPGIWGPYRDVILPQAFLAEGGQSATGELIRNVVESHPAYSVTKQAADQEGLSVYDFLNEQLRLQVQRSRAAHVPYLARHFFFYGDLWGNRSPIADSSMTGAIVGLRGDRSMESLALHYYGALEFIALQTRQIVETMNKHGHQITSIFMSGSQTQNNILVHLIASLCNVPVVIPQYVHAAVCHGAAMLGAKAASATQQQISKDLWSIMGEMSKPGRRIDPTTDTDEQQLLQAKYNVFLDMCFRQREYRSIVDKMLLERD